MISFINIFLSVGPLEVVMPVLSARLQTRVVSSTQTPELQLQIIEK